MLLKEYTISITYIEYYDIFLEIEFLQTSQTHILQECAADM